jgi:hypothetical protein
MLMLTRTQNRRKVNWWPWARCEFGALVHAGVSHGHRPCVLEGTARHCKSGDRSAHADADVNASVVRGCGVGAAAKERVRQSRHHHLSGGRVGKIVLGGLVEARRELMLRSG